MTKPNNSRAPTTKDPDFIEVIRLLRGHNAKAVAAASDNLVGRSTIYNWKRGKVRRPQHYTMQAALRAIGWEYSLRKRSDKKEYPLSKKK